jgi:hypothetical protein
MATAPFHSCLFFSVCLANRNRIQRSLPLRVDDVNGRRAGRETGRRAFLTPILVGNLRVITQDSDLLGVYK